MLAASLLAALAVSAAGALENPFAGKAQADFYINPVNFQQYEESIASAEGKVRENLREMQKVPSAYWIDVKAKIRATGGSEDHRSLEGILRDAASKSKPQLTVFMWYDLPNRDCKAHASNGEICCNKNADGSCNYKLGGDCAEGLREYKEEYVEPFIEVLSKFMEKVPIVVVVEPDSLPNLATNVAHPHCGSEATKRAYRVGINYALHALAKKAPKVTVYLDAAHGGWLGWENSMEAFMKVLRSMDLPKIRGFATNVANYQPLGLQCPWRPDQGFRNGYCLNGRHRAEPCCADPCGLASQYNFGNNELNYAAGLVAAADQMLGWDAHVIIDTGRNGVVDHRSLCSNWCNPRSSGAGVKSTTEVANKSYVDAYFWLKTPGESDGCTETLPGGGKCPRFDVMCGSADSLGSRQGEPRAPEAGRWYDHQVKELAANANFKESAGGSVVSEGEYVPAGGLPEGQEASSTTPRHTTTKERHGSCSKAYGQCGGRHWQGPTCCETGCRCRHEGEWYSQCEPPSGHHMCSANLLLAEELPEPLPHAARPSLVGCGGAAAALVAVAAVVAVVRRQGREAGAERLICLEEAEEST